MLAACGVSASTISAQDYPSRPIRVVIPYGIGGSADVLVRVIAPHASANLGQQLVIDNRGGGAGLPAITLVAKAAPNGYTALHFARRAQHRGVSHTRVRGDDLARCFLCPPAHR